MNTRILHRSLIAAGLLLAGAVAAPAAFARSHVSIGLGFYGPGYSVGYNNCVNCYYGRAYYPAYSGYYPVYSTPTYYYEPAPVYYDPYPVYGTVYYNGYYGGGYYGGGRYYRHHGRGDWRHGHGDHRWHGHDRNGWHH
jgi:hypothetical protein